METAKAGNLSLRITPTEAHEHRFLLYMITYLLCAPSALANVVRDQGDLDAFLKKAGIDREKASSRTREICLEFVNQIKSNSTLWAFINSTQASLNTFFTMPVYDPPPCPGQGDTTLLLTTAHKMNPKAHTNGNGSR